MTYDEARTLYFRTMGVLYVIHGREPLEKEIGDAFDFVYEIAKAKGIFDEEKKPNS